MNQKIEIFSFVALPSPNTKKNHPKWDLGKDFSSQAFKGRQKIKIRAFPKTSRKRFWNGRLIDWRLWRQCWFFRAEKRSAQASAHPLSPAFVCLVLLEFWQRLNEIHEVSTFPQCKGFFLFVFLVVVVFSSLENYFGFRTTNVRVKTEHQSVWGGTSFILVLCQRTVMLTLASEQTWALKTSSEL